MDEARQKLIQNERSKLVAALVNNIATAFVVSGFVVPLVTTAYGNVVSKGPYWVVYGLLWLCMGILLHLAARWKLGDLET